MTACVRGSQLTAVWAEHEQVLHEWRSSELVDISGVSFCGAEGASVGHQ